MSPLESLLGEVDTHLETHLLLALSVAVEEYYMPGTDIDVMTMILVEDSFDANIH
jgi:hypothetical protein